MLDWYKKLYVGETAKKKEKKLVRRISRGRMTPGVYLITLASNGRDQLDILSAVQAVWRGKRGLCPPIVGLAGSYGEALELVEQMARETFDQTGRADIRSYLTEWEEEGK